MSTNFKKLQRDVNLKIKTLNDEIKLEKEKPVNTLKEQKALNYYQNKYTSQIKNFTKNIEYWGTCLEQQERKMRQLQQDIDRTEGMITKNKNELKIYEETSFTKVEMASAESALQKAYNAPNPKLVKMTDKLRALCQEKASIMERSALALEETIPTAHLEYISSGTYLKYPGHDYVSWNYYETHPDEQPPTWKDGDTADEEDEEENDSVKSR